MNVICSFSMFLNQSSIYLNTILELSLETTVQDKSCLTLFEVGSNFKMSVQTHIDIEAKAKNKLILNSRILQNNNLF